MEFVARGLSLARGARSLAHGLDLALEPGQVWAVLGPNGCGKSTLLLTLAGLLAARSGQIRLDGRDLSDWGAKDRSLRIAWQGVLPPTDFGLRVQERLEVVPRGKRAVAGALERLDLEGLASRRLYELSAGEQQRVELAALWLRDAPLWLLDEPTAHLDLKHQVDWLEQLRDEAKQGRSLVVVLHDLTQAHAIASQALLLNGDSGSCVGPAEELLRPSQLERFFDTRIHETSGPGGISLVPDYREGRSVARGDEA